MADSFLPLSRLRARLATPRGKDRIEALLAAEDTAAAVAALPVADIYQIVYEVGFADALELIALATPEQLRGCLDIDVWDRDHLQLEAARPWLTALIEAGHERLAEVWEGLDAELRALLLARSTHIYDLSLGEEPDDSDGRPIALTPDGYFAVKLTADDDDTVRLVHRLIDDLYRADPSGQLARHTLMAARSEPMAELEEMSYRWRSGRMADMGYVDFHDALDVFRPLDPASVRIDEGTEDRFGEVMDDDALRPGALPIPIAERVIGKGFLARALDRVTATGEMERLELALVVLVNKVLAAARVSPGDPEAVHIGAEHASATLALGLEAVSQGDLDGAARALETVSLTRLHRVGHTIVLRLALFAHRLRARVPAAGPPSDALVAALCAPRPLFPREFDEEARQVAGQSPGQEARQEAGQGPGQAPGSGLRAFESMADVRVVAEALTGLALRLAVADSLGVDVTAEAPGSRPALDDHVRTALVRAMMGRDLIARPLAVEDIATFVSRAMAGGTLTEEARQAGAAALAARLDQARVTAARHMLPGLVDGWFADIEDALGHLPERPDPRFIDRVLIARE